MNNNRRNFFKFTGTVVASTLVGACSTTALPVKVTPPPAVDPTKPSGPPRYTPTQLAITLDGSTWWKYETWKTEDGIIGGKHTQLLVYRAHGIYDLKTRKFLKQRHDTIKPPANFNDLPVFQFKS